MAKFDQPGAALIPTRPEVEREVDTPKPKLRPAPHWPFGRRAIDKMTDVVGTPLHKASPLFGNAYDHGMQLRTLFGNGYVIFPAAGVYLGAWAVKDTHGLALPPTLWLTITIMVLSIFDAFSGLMATATFAVGVIASGHLFSSHWLYGPPGTQGMLYAFTGLLTMAFLWFIGGQLPRRVRILGFNAIKNTFQRRYVIAADFFVITLLMILILGSVPIFVPIFTGADKQSLTQVVLQNHLVAIKIAVGIAAFVKVGLDSWLHHKFELIPKSVGRERSTITKWILRIVASAIALALVWEIVGTIWQWPVIWVLLVSLDLLSAMGERFLKPSAIYRYVPRNLFRIVTLLLLCQYGARILSGRIVTGSQLLGWLVLLVVIAVSVYAILDGPDDEEEGDRPATWLTRLIGIIVVVALFLLSQQLIGIPATPYANESALAAGPNGALYIADSGNNRVIMVAPNGDRSTIGTGLSNPSGVAPDPTSSPTSIYIADTNNNRVLRVELTATQAAALTHPHAHVAFADAATNQIAIGLPFSHPTGLSTNAQGLLYVADTGNNRVVLVSPIGYLVNQITGLSSPLAVSADPFGNVYVANSGTGTVLRYKVTRGGQSISSPTIVARGLSSPAGVAADAEGNFFVSDTGNNRVYEYQSDHRRHTVRGDFLRPRGLAVDGAGHLYVADAGHGIVILSEPVYVPHTYSYGATAVPSAVARASDGSFYVVNAAAGTLEHVTSSGTTLILTHLNEPNGVAWSVIGRLYVSQAGNGTILEVNPTTGSYKILTTGLLGITSITPDPYGGLLAIEPTPGNLVYISAKGKAKILYSKLQSPTSIVEDAYDNFDVTLQGTHAHGGAVWRIVSGHGAQVLASGLSSPGSITADGNGDVFFVERGTNRVWEDRGLNGTQIIWQGRGPRTNPVQISSDLAGNVTVFPATPGREIVLHASTTKYEL